MEEVQKLVLAKRAAFKATADIDKDLFTANKRQVVGEGEGKSFYR